MNVLAVGAHPDDLEILCGGTLAKYAQRGDRVTMVTCANGDCGSARHSREEIAAIRDQEARAAAAVIGAEYICLGFSDLEIALEMESRKTMAESIRRVQPDLILLHAPNDYMMDHRDAYTLAEHASFDATIPNLVTEHPPLQNPAPIFLMDTIVGLGFEPTEYVDVSEVFDTKMKMLECHASQVAWLQHHDAASPTRLMEIQTAFRGAQCGVRYAEGFRPQFTWGRVVARRLLP
jgi:LmbE family N-acetylglucosaminyl deacetylase